MDQTNFRKEDSFSMRSSKDHEILSHDILDENNPPRLILESVGEDVLIEIIKRFQDFLDHAITVFERNGDYAIRLLPPSWCQYLDEQSSKSCGECNDRDAKESRKWYCRESCWNVAKIAIHTQDTVDMPCLGGIHHYSIPIVASGSVVGAISIGYGNPPQDKKEIQKLSKRYKVSRSELHDKAMSYKSQSNWIINIARDRIQTIAKYIGTLVANKQAELALRHTKERFSKLIDNVPGVFFQYLQDQSGKDGKYLYVSAGVRDLYELAPEAVQQDSSLMHMAIHGRDQDSFTMSMLRAKKTMENWNWEWRIVTYSGKQKWVKGTAKLDFLTDGRVLWNGFIWDVTDRKQIKNDDNKITNFRDNHSNVINAEDENMMIER